MTMDAGTLIRQMQAAISAGAPVGQVTQRANQNLQGGHMAEPPGSLYGSGMPTWDSRMMNSQPQQMPMASGMPSFMQNFSGPVMPDTLTGFQGMGATPDQMAQFMAQRGLTGAVRWGPNGAEAVDPSTMVMPRGMGGGGPGMGGAMGQPDLQSLLAQLGWDVDPNTRFIGGNSAVLPTYATQGAVDSRGMGSSFAITEPSDFGFGIGNGVPGGDMAAYLQNQGFPDMSIPNALRAGAPLGGSNVGRAAQRLGNVNVTSPQQMAQLGPSGLEFLRGMIETMLGIPFEDYLNASLQPFQGLQGAPMARGRTSGMTR